MGKRKADDDFSTNPRTRKERARKAALDPQHAEYENRKHADHQAEIRALERLRAHPEFMEADEDKRTQLVDQCKAQLIDGR
jgi:hypothetical protein